MADTREQNEVRQTCRHGKLIGYDCGLCELQGPDRPPSEPRELLCMVCGVEHPVWSADSDLWNAAIRGGVRGNADEWEFLCPTCFMRIASERGVEDSFRVTRAPAPRTTGTTGTGAQAYDVSRAVAPSSERAPDGYVVEGHIEDGFWWILNAYPVREAAEVWLELHPRWSEAGARIRPFAYIDGTGTPPAAVATPLEFLRCPARHDGVQCDRAYEHDGSHLGPGAVQWRTHEGSER